MKLIKKKLNYTFYQDNTNIFYCAKHIECSFLYCFQSLEEKQYSLQFTGKHNHILIPKQYHHYSRYFRSFINQLLFEKFVDGFEIIYQLLKRYPNNIELLEAMYYFTCSEGLFLKFLRYVIAHTHNTVV